MSLVLNGSFRTFPTLGPFFEKFGDDPIFKSGYSQLLETANVHLADAAGFLAAVTLTRDTDVYDPRVEKVALITMHAAKGLEFPVVFILITDINAFPAKAG